MAHIGGFLVGFVLTFLLPWESRGAGLDLTLAGLHPRRRRALPAGTSASSGTHSDGVDSIQRKKEPSQSSTGRVIESAGEVKMERQVSSVAGDTCRRCSLALIVAGSGSSDESNGSIP